MRKSSSEYETVLIGAGPVCLATSWYLTQAGRSHALVLGLPWQRIGEAGVITVL